jgi:uncharacterized protein YjbI with pentapeptide repeats
MRHTGEPTGARGGEGGSGNDRSLALMLTAMRNVPLRRLVIALASALVIFAAFAAGTGMYAAALALWPLVLVWWPWVLAGAVGVVAVGAWWLWWWLPRWQVNHLRLTIYDPKAWADVEDNFRKTITQLFAGLVTLFAGIVALSAAVIAYLQLSQQQKASHDLLISNQVSKGFEQLGNATPVIRLGGIYALEGVMNTSEQYHQPVLEALSAFVRDGTNPKTGAKTGEGPPSTDIQAALTVIGRRKIIEPEKPLNLTNAHIPKAQLSDANLIGVDLSHANLSGADLSGANLTGANLTGVDLTGVDLHSANLPGARLSGISLSAAKLNHANLTDASLSFVDLSNADLSNANLRGVHMLRSNLRGANLSAANLSGVDLGGADLRDVNLSFADVSGANLTGKDLRGANLSGANLSAANLSVAFITQAQLDQACGINVKFGPGLTIKPCQTSPPGK